MPENLVGKMDSFFRNGDKVLASAVAAMNSEMDAIDAQRDELNATLDERAERIRKVLAELGAPASSRSSAATQTRAAAPKASATKSGGAKSGGRGGASKGGASAGSTAAGNKAIAYLRAHAGQFVASETLAAEIGTTRVGDAIKATADAAEVESRGPGRKKEYRIKK